MMLGEELAKRTKLPTRFIVYLCDRAVANGAEYISRSVRYTEAGIATLYGLEDSGFKL